QGGRQDLIGGQAVRLAPLSPLGRGEEESDTLCRTVYQAARRSDLAWRWMSVTSRPDLKTETIPVDCDRQTATALVEAVMPAAAACRVPSPPGSRECGTVGTS